MGIYILSGLCLFLLLLCVLGFNALRRMFMDAEDAKMQRLYLDKALRAHGIWDEYQLAWRDSWRLRGEAERAEREATQQAAPGTR